MNPLAFAYITFISFESSSTIPTSIPWLACGMPPTSGRQRRGVAGSEQNGNDLEVVRRVGMRRQAGRWEQER